MDSTRQGVVHKDDDRMTAYRSLAPNSKAALVSAGYELYALNTDKIGFGTSTLDENISFNEAYSNSPSAFNEVSNTMTERDLGSTFLLPHTHLYKSDKIPYGFSRSSSS
ncbi:uncharacterized protein LOC6523701 isoform X7 [Drosophila yakuba]|nr:uncharacterized protein LOC6523701 isoform X7 [Drosophila yakuba]